MASGQRGSEREEEEEEAEERDGERASERVVLFVAQGADVTPHRVFGHSVESFPRHRV